MIINLICQCCQWRETPPVTWVIPTMIFGHLKNCAGPVSVSVVNVPNEAPHA